MKKELVECIVFRKKNDTIQFLLLKRIASKGGFWQPVGGGVDENDKSVLSAAYREIKEEANISKEDIIRVFENVHYFEMDKHYLTGEPIEIRKEFVFGFEVKPDFVVSIDKNIYVEHEEIKWVSFDDAQKLLKWDDNKTAFKKLNDLIKKN